MVFDYYHRLSRSHKAVYRKSDAIERIPLNRPGAFRRRVELLQAALATEKRAQTQAAAAALVDEIIADLSVPVLQTRVLSARPSRDWGELHGLYEPADKGPARITVWMRTAKHKRVVAFRSFLRTVLHELCHHLDYELLGLAESFHTEGFFKRESDLFHQLMKVPDESLSTRDDRPPTTRPLDL